MKELVLFLLLTIYSMNSVACSCWTSFVNPDNPNNRQNTPHFTFSVVSGDMIFPDAIEQARDKEKYVTLIKVIDVGTSERAEGDLVEISQQNNPCHKVFQRQAMYELYRDRNEKEQAVESCSIQVIFVPEVTTND